MIDQINTSFQDVRQYSKEFLQIHSDEIYIPVSYKRSWNDGFGARGWKLDATISDPEIIASTSETGQKINTSVFVHDILDHFLSGFGVSGHRSEAMALIQLSKRTNSDPRPDYEQMVREDIINGHVNGESLMTFLPEQLVDLLPSGMDMTNSEIMSFLNHEMDGDSLRDCLIAHFFTLGKAGEQHAIDSWIALGLNSEKQTDIGLSLQKLLEVMDSKVKEMSINELEGSIKIHQNTVAFVMQNGNEYGPIEDSQTYFT